VNIGLGARGARYCHETGRRRQDHEGRAKTRRTGLLPIGTGPSRKPNGAEHGRSSTMPRSVVGGLCSRAIGQDGVREPDCARATHAAHASVIRAAGLRIAGMAAFHKIDRLLQRIVRISMVVPPSSPSEGTTRRRERSSPAYAGMHIIERRTEKWCGAGIEFRGKFHRPCERP